MYRRLRDLRTTAYQRVHDDRDTCVCVRARVTGMARVASDRCEKAFIEEVYGDYFLIYMEEDAEVLKNRRGR